MKQNLNLERDSVKKLFFAFAIPSILSMVTTSLYTIADGIFISRGVAPEALAAVNIGYPLINFTTAISLMFGIGGATLISIKSDDLKYKNKCFSHIIILNLVLFAIVALLVFGFTNPILKIMGADDALLPMVKDYIFPCTLAVFFQMLSVSLNAVVRNDGAPKRAMNSMLVGAVLNVILDYFFIFTFHLGISGGAYATAISQVVSALYLCHYFLSSTFRLSFKNFDFKLAKRILSIGFSSFVLEFAVAVITVVLNVALMKKVGILGASAYGIISYSFMFLRMWFTGLSHGIQPIVSFNYGKNNFSRVKEIYYYTHKISALCAIIALISVKLWGIYVVKIFNNVDPELITMATRGLFLYTAAIVFLSANFVNISYYQAIERVTFSNLISISRSITFVIIGLFTLPEIIGVDGIWLTLPFADTMTCCCTLAFNFFSRKNDKAVSVGI